MGHAPSERRSSSEGTHHCKQLRFIQEGHHYTYVELSKSAIDSHTAFVQTKGLFLVGSLYHALQVLRHTVCFVGTRTTPAPGTFYHDAILLQFWGCHWLFNDTLTIP